ncbi:MAG: type II CAAX endopeptidase family protein, partial [Leuconostoc gelidum]
MSKIIRIEQLPTSIFTIIFSFLWYSFTQLPLIVGESLTKYSLIFNILGTIYVLVIAGSCIYVLSRIYGKYSTKNSSLSRIILFRYTLVFFIVMTAYNTFCDYIFPTTKNQKTIENMINGNTFFVGILIFTIIAPILEELIFRGLFINMIFKQNTFWVPVISSGIIFGSLHAASNIMEWLYYVIFGMILAT